MAIVGRGDVYWIPMGLILVGLGLGPAIEILRHGFEFTFGLAFIFFFLWGLYVLIGRFILKPLPRRRTYYAVTTKRLLVLRTFPRESLGATYLDSILTVTKEGDRRGRGTITFGSNPMGRASEDVEFLLPPFGPPGPAFVNITDVEHVHALVDSLRQDKSGAKHVG